MYLSIFSISPARDPGSQWPVPRRPADRTPAAPAGSPSPWRRWCAGLFPAAQDRCVAGFQAQGGDVDRHVGTRFIYHANHPSGTRRRSIRRPLSSSPPSITRPTGSARLHTGAHRRRCRSDAPGSAQGDRASLHSDHWRELPLNLPRWRAEYRRSALPDNRRSFPVPVLFPAGE